MRTDRFLAGVSPRARLAGVIVAAALLIGLLALASRPGTTQVATGTANPGPILAIVHLIEIGGVAIELAVILLLLVIYRPLRRRKNEEDEFQLYVEPVEMPWVLKAVLVALPLLVIGALVYAVTRLSSGDQSQALFPVVPMAPLPEAGTGAGGATGSPLGLSWWELAIACSLAVLAVVVFMRGLRTPTIVHTDSPVPHRQAAMEAAVSMVLRDAQDERDPRRAIIVAYAAMEEQLASLGLARGRGEAPLEYLDRLRDSLEISAASLLTLTDLYELARFSHHEIPLAAKQQAIAALTSLKQELEAAS